MGQNIIVLLYRTNLLQIFEYHLLSLHIKTASHHRLVDGHKWPVWPPLPIITNRFQTTNYQSPPRLYLSDHQSPPWGSIWVSYNLLAVLSRRAATPSVIWMELDIFSNKVLWQKWVIGCCCWLNCSETVTHRITVDKVLELSDKK